MEQWARLPDDDGAGSNTNDTTEVQVGAGIEVPSWAHSIKCLNVHMIYLALTTKETVAGYFRLANDNNSIDPLNFPLPVVTALTGAIATHEVEDFVTVPVEVPVTAGKGDTIRMYAGLDEASTGVHTIQGFILFSSDSAEGHMHAEKTASTAGSATANTKGTVVNLSTVADKASSVIGFWNYNYSYPTAAQTGGGYILIESNLTDFKPQRLPTNTTPSGLSTAIHPITKPVFAVPEWFIRKGLSGYSTLRWNHELAIPNKAVTTFKCASYMDGTNTVAPAMRTGIIYKE